MQKILISRCLLGEKVRYDGGGKFIDHPLIKKWLDEKRLIAVCPEVEGGLPIPRAAAEIQGNGGGEAVLQKQIFIKNTENEDVTKAFIKGAEIALKLAQGNNIKIAILKARSPSCGNSEIYDGSFSKKVISGEGVTTALLRQHGIQVYNEDQVDLVGKMIAENDS